MSFEQGRRLSVHRKKSPSWIRIMCLICLGFFGFIGYVYIHSVGTTLVRSGSYTLQKGVTLSSLPNSLGISLDSWRYKLWLKLFLTTKPYLQAGTYILTEDTSLEVVLSRTLSKPVHTDITITILPGWNMYDIDNYLSEKNIIPTGAFLLMARDSFSTFQKKYSFLQTRLSMEGFLYPDTYRILPNADAYMIIDRLLSEWQKKIGDSYTALGERGYNMLILASVVEREERNTTQKPIVAGILAKRVSEGIAMGADATVCYGYAKTQKQCTPEFIASVIAIKHPYNTRNKQGYPPTPISSISENTWNATIQSSPSSYYYYLHDFAGAIHYAESLDVHNANKLQYLQ